ncbi:Glycine receptor subunit beta-type 4 [Eumeta japonica]|uniref:Glycine receptor subunit beta-type 4 n=1 Tax=Eumeta variegata TaxID=151549 RepID=A0A4C1Z932_EUMVA|nr:Glycine receptor subunit beta-type 4 [Eumeta japonica]
MLTADPYLQYNARNSAAQSGNSERYHHHHIYHHHIMYHYTLRKYYAPRPFLLLHRVPTLLHCDAFLTNFTATEFREHSAARLVITLSRELRGYLLESYLPSSLFVIMSWGSFCVIPEIVPGRMVLLVTTLLSLITMFDTVSTNSPDALELKCIEVWLISCTIFVFLALLEYFVVLFGIRYDKNWSRRRQDLRRAASAAQLAPPPLIINHSPVCIHLFFDTYEGYLRDFKITGSQCIFLLSNLMPFNFSLVLENKNIHGAKSAKAAREYGG